MIIIKKEIIKKWWDNTIGENIESVLVWNISEEFGRCDYEVIKYKEFVNLITNTVNGLQEELYDVYAECIEFEEDIDDIEMALFKLVYDYEFDFETKGLVEYFNPHEFLADPSYEYCTIVSYSENQNQSYITDILYSKIEIDYENINELLLKNGEDLALGTCTICNLEKEDVDYLYENVGFLYENEQETLNTVYLD